MKKLILLTAATFLCSLAFTGCKKEEKPDPNIRDYTSFVFWFNEEIGMPFPNCVVGYFTTDGLCHKLAELGDLYKGVKSKEVRVDDESITKVYFFCDYYGVRMTERAFVLRKNYKNIFEIIREDVGIPVEKDDPYKYPH